MDLIKNIGKTMYKWWMAFARVISIASTAILLTIVYVVVIGPMSIISRIFGKDLLTHHESSGSFWKVKEQISHTLDQSRHQF